MNRAFADASFLLPVSLHEAGRRRQVDQILAEYPNTEYVTSDGVLSEMLARVSRLGPKVRNDTAAMVRDIRASDSQFLVVPTSADLFNRGLARYVARSDQRYSHVDCVTMEIMDELGIQYVLTFDSDFHGEGRYVVLPGPASTRRPRS